VVSYLLLYLKKEELASEISSLQEGVLGMKCCLQLRIRPSWDSLSETAWFTDQQGLVL